VWGKRGREEGEREREFRTIIGEENW